MQNLYPVFERNRILKKEMLSAIRDYPVWRAKLEYEEYGDGILQGFPVKVEERYIVIGPGMVKWNGFIGLMTEAEMVHYQPSEEVTVLKLRLEREVLSPDFIAYKMEPVLEAGTLLAENEFEICRYKLQSGAELRENHKNFVDMGTEFDTLNYINASWGGLNGKALAPMVTRRFAKEILETDGVYPEDISFAYFCMSQPGAVPMEILRDYISRRSRKEVPSSASGTELFEVMCAVLGNIGQADAEMPGRHGRRRIIVD